MNQLICEKLANRNPKTIMTAIKSNFSTHRFYAKETGEHTRIEGEMRCDLFIARNCVIYGTINREKLSRY